MLINRQGCMGSYKPELDIYKSILEVIKSLKLHEIPNLMLMIGVDYTFSNNSKGTETYHGKSLHYIPEGDDSKGQNPYEYALGILKKLLNPCVRGNKIYAFGFGDENTMNISAFPFKEDGTPCYGIDEVIERYRYYVKTVNMAGPSNITPLIFRCINMISSAETLAESITTNLLVILTDGDYANMSQIKQGLHRAEQEKLYIIVIGLGDGPWDDQEELEQFVQKEKLACYKFLNINELIFKTTGDPDVCIAAHIASLLPMAKEPNDWDMSSFDG